MITKKIDSVGRIVIPMELRNSLGWKSNDEIELCEQDGKLILTKHIIKQGQCAICGSKEKLLCPSDPYQHPKTSCGFHPREKR